MPYRQVGGHMPRYVAFLRGVSPMNARMADLRRCFEVAGFGNVKIFQRPLRTSFQRAA